MAILSRRQVASLPLDGTPMTIERQCQRCKDALEWNSFNQRPKHGLDLCTDCILGTQVCRHSGQRCLAARADLPIVRKLSQPRQFAGPLREHAALHHRRVQLHKFFARDQIPAFAYVE